MNDQSDFWPFVRRHLLILLMVTVVIRGWLLVSYPIGGLSTDDNQAGQRYLIDEILRGNMFIGNLRYHTGYALVMSPVAAITSRFGRLDDRLLLLVQAAMGVPMAAANGVATRHYLEIVTLPPLRPVTFLADSYPLWRSGGVSRVHG